jgi:hypothetical protein
VLYIHTYILDDGLQEGPEHVALLILVIETVMLDSNKFSNNEVYKTNLLQGIRVYTTECHEGSLVSM